MLVPVPHVLIRGRSRAAFAVKSPRRGDALILTTILGGVAVKYVEISCLVVSIIANDPATRVFAVLAK